MRRRCRIIWRGALCRKRASRGAFSDQRGRVGPGDCGLTLASLASANCSSGWGAAADRWFIPVACLLAPQALVSSSTEMNWLALAELRLVWRIRAAQRFAPVVREPPREVEAETLRRPSGLILMVGGWRSHATKLLRWGYRTTGLSSVSQPYARAIRSRTSCIKAPPLSLLVMITIP